MSTRVAKSLPSFVNTPCTMKTCVRGCQNVYVRNDFGCVGTMTAENVQIRSGMRSVVYRRISRGNCFWRLNAAEIKTYACIVVCCTCPQQATGKDTRVLQNIIQHVVTYAVLLRRFTTVVRPKKNGRSTCVCRSIDHSRAPFPGIVRSYTFSAASRVFNVFNEGTFAPLAKHFETAHKLSIC